MNGILLKIKQNYAVCLTNAVKFLAGYTHKMNFYGCFPTRVHVSERRSLKGSVVYNI
jgi:hypothetical protein